MKKDEAQKLIDTLKKAKAYALQSTADDGGTCNLDHVYLRIKNLTEKQAKEIENASGVRLSKWNAGEWHFYGYTQGQANRRTDMAERFNRIMRASGYNTFIYYQMD